MGIYDDRLEVTSLAWSSQPRHDDVAADGREFPCAKRRHRCSVPVYAHHWPTEIGSTIEESRKPIKETTKETAKEILMRAMRENLAIIAKELAPIAGLTEAGVRYRIDKMRKDGMLEREGSTKAGKWIVKA